MLDPRPRDFTTAVRLDRARILDALRRGRPGTAMKSFSALLSDDEMQDVAGFVEETFVDCAAHNTSYHTAENGWADHQTRYAPAVPFATGEIAVDVPAELLGEVDREGLALFRSACISCHQGRIARARPLAIVQAESVPAHDADSDHAVDQPGHVDDYDTPTIHDIPPEIADLSPAERRGRELYARACAQCHAADGTGMNWIGKFLKPEPPDFASADFIARFDSAVFAMRTLEAPEDTTMPSFRSVLSTSEVRDITSYVRRAFVKR